MQTISIVPLVFFLFIYANDSISYLLLSIVFLLLLGINVYRYIKNLQLIRYPLLLILVGSFLVYGFQGLGSMQAPQSFQTLKSKSDTTVFKMGSPAKIDQFCYYIGIDKDTNFVLEYKDQEKWKSFYTYEKKFPFSFRWNCLESNITTDQVRMRITKGEMMLGEVRLMHNGTPLEINASIPYLTDEPEPAVDSTYYGGMFFDEIYFGRAAYELIHGMAVYETVHPYLGKLLITPGVKLFGMTPFGWRFVNVLFAAMMIVLMYYLAQLLFRKRLFAFTAAFLMTYGFMHLTQARLALIDTFGVFFVLVSYYFFYRFIVRQRLSLLLLSGVFFGLASAVKWSAVFASLGFVAIALYLLFTRYPLEKRFSGYRLLLYGILSYGVVALSVYALSFYEIYLQTGSFQSIIEYQLRLFRYHSTLVSTHPYSSAWWSWPIDFRPMCYYREIQGDLFSSITAFGNPAIFWVGTVSLLYLLYVVVRRVTLEAFFILTAFLGLYLPYAFIGREMFIYHFYYAVPFMMLAIVYMLKDMMHYFPKYRKVYFIYLAVTAVLFLAFYPVLSGYEVPKAYVDHGLIWFSGWWL